MSLKTNTYVCSIFLLDSRTHSLLPRVYDSNSNYNSSYDMVHQMTLFSRRGTPAQIKKLRTKKKKQKTYLKYRHLCIRSNRYFRFKKQLCNMVSTGWSFDQGMFQPQWKKSHIYPIF